MNKSSLDEKLEQKILEINESIEKIGFENTANIYSISNTSNKRWIELVGLMSFKYQLKSVKKLKIKN